MRILRELLWQRKTVSDRAYKSFFARSLSLEFFIPQCKYIIYIIYTSELIEQNKAEPPRSVKYAEGGTSRTCQYFV